MFEYAISAGEGTLIDYGVCSFESIMDMLVIAGTKIGTNVVLTIAFASPDCLTGK